MLKAHIYADGEMPKQLVDNGYISWHNTETCCLPADFVYADYPLLLIKHDAKLIYSQSFKTKHILIKQIERILGKLVDKIV